MLGAAELGIGMGLTHALGVFDHRMPRIYKRLGWAPDVLGTKDQISAGIWAFDPDKRGALAERAGLPVEASNTWFQAAFSWRAQCLGTPSAVHSNRGPIP